jgi:hypothetical protein
MGKLKTKSSVNGRWMSAGGTVPAVIAGDSSRKKKRFGMAEFHFSQQ